MKARIEKDTLGTVEVPGDAYWGVQTQRAIENFPVSGRRLPRRFIRAQGIIKLAAARTHLALGVLPKRTGAAIERAAEEVRDGKLDDHFRVDVYQAGAGTSQNMNANEVIANRALEILGKKRGAYEVVHPNDHVNMAQSTNDTIPTAIHISALEALREDLLPAVKDLAKALGTKARQFRRVVKPGRTHLQDAVPIRLGQEFGGYAASIGAAAGRLVEASRSLYELALGGTAVGTGLNAHPRYAELAIRDIRRQTGLPFRRAADPFRAIQNVEAALEVSGALREMAVSLIKIANDLRLLGSDARVGLGELMLPAVQPGSSIMPGKVNPVLPEMMDMVCFQLLGNDLAVTMAVQAAQLDLNVMMPVIAYNLLDSTAILAGGIRAFTVRCVAGLEANERRCRELVERSLAIATALNPRIGYARAAEVAKEAYREDKTIREIVVERGLLTPAEARDLLDPEKLTG